MTYDDTSLFKFNLNELLWFKRGQEVDELMGISLEPNISIQEYNDYVSVRGVIELAGEYYQTEEAVDDSQVLSLREHASKRTIEDVQRHEDGISEFFYQFPVEITIPKHRVASLDDVMVSVDSFDYEIPESSQLNLKATVVIHGVQGEMEDYETEEEDRSHEESISEEYHLGDTFNFDIKHVESSSSSKESSGAFNMKDMFNKPEMEESPLESPELVEEEIEVEERPEEESLEKEESGRWKYKKVQTFSEFFGKEEVLEESSDHLESSSMLASSEMESHLKLNIDETESDEESSEFESRRDAGYLTNIFERESEGERTTQMRMYIVQNGDSLQSIAERYNVPSIQLMRANKLEDDYLSEGQILYLPSKVKEL